MANSDQPASGTAAKSKTLLERGKELLRQGNLEESETIFKEVAVSGVDSSQGNYGLGIIQLKRGDYPGAVEIFQTCLRSDPKNANVYYYLGEAWQKQNLPDAALAFFRKAIEIDPNHRGAREKLGNVPVHSPEAASHGDGISQRHGHEVRGSRGELADGPPTYHSGGVYEYLRNDPSPLAKQTIRLLDSLTINSVTPRISAFAGQIVFRLLAALLIPVVVLGFFPAEHSGPSHPLLPLLRSAIWVMGLVFLVQSLPRASGFLNRVLTIAALVCVLYVLFGAPLVLSRYTQRFVSDPKPIAIMVGFGLLISALMFLVGTKAMKFTLDQGRIKVSSGLFAKRDDNIELFRVVDVKLFQTCLNRLTHDGTLYFYGEGGGCLAKITGISEIGRLHELFEGLRNVIVLLRSGTLAKGIIR